jgi:hypothetical protein
LPLQVRMISGAAACAVGLTWQAMAHTNPASYRATAVAAITRFFFAASRPNR